ncbi:adenylate/guanylate cyclase domain-containing protein [Hoeflea sp. TYP-13]|uniref:adenylate/guanylate cyclase domain-containing protein n=1 Tax=Hoeflea sp. TYP-13 TaxID=3230023 RepID=UPI0034C60824
MPERVRAAIDERERANEIMARLIQLTIVLLFSAIYTISPKTSPDEAFSPVPYVLGAYLVVSIIGLIWSIRQKLPHWSVYGSILFDFGLLYSLMVSFHIQYMQPASFILKAPTLLYVFIFIAIRALRFEARFVIAAGMVAAAGWAAVIIYVTRIDSGDNMLTRSYVEYLTSNSILIGAEIDKILSILFVTGVLTLVVNASKNLLVSAVTEEQAASDLSRFFDTSIASGIRESADRLEAGKGENREAAILFIDIRGFTRMAAAMEASDVMLTLSRYQSRVVPIVQQCGGVIDKFMGDGIMATFSFAGDRAAGSLKAIEAAESILRDCDKWAAEEPALKVISSTGIGLGVASGPVAFGAVGQENRLEITVIGSAVNYSAKLEKHNKVIGSRLIAAAATYREALEKGYAGALQAEFTTQQLEGVAEPQEIAVLSLQKLESAPVSSGAPFQEPIRIRPSPKTHSGI